MYRGILDSLEEMKKFCEEYRMHCFCVCTKLDTVLCVEKTFEDANKFVDEHNHVELRIVEVGQGGVCDK